MQREGRMSNLAAVIKPKGKDLGDNFVVRRALPHIDKRMVGPFIFWDHMGPVTLKRENGMIVRAHPHIGLATITWLFSGEILHRDSLNNEQYIKPGEVNWMTAGNGIAHSERAIPKDQPMNLEGIQLWLALPKEHEDVAPSFFHCKSKDLPKQQLGNTSLSLIAGKALGNSSPVPVYSDLFYLEALSQANDEFSFEVESEHEGAIYVGEGEIEVENNNYEKFSMLCFKKGCPIKFKANVNSRVMIFGGAIFPEKRFIWWNFVSTSEEKIENAKKRWSSGEFQKVINETELIPLP